MAEAHPVGFRWAMKARERGATIIHVDPRFSRTSAMADMHVPIRAGSDIAFLGGLIRHVLHTGAYFKEYVVNYTNAATLVREDFKGPEDLAGYFSGWDPDTATYDPNSWGYVAARWRRPPACASIHAGLQRAGRRRDAHGSGQERRVARAPAHRVPPADAPLRALHARDGRARVRHLAGRFPARRRHAGRQLRPRAHHRLLLRGRLDPARRRRADDPAAAVLQLLLGNMGRPGGGILALRGHASIQGSTDIPTLYDLLPGYLPMAKARAGEYDLDTYVKSNGSERGWWANFDKYAVSLLKAYFGDAATAENDYGFGRLPKITGNHSHFPTMLRALDGGLDGLFVMGQNPAVGALPSSSRMSSVRRTSRLAGGQWLGSTGSASTLP